MAKKKASVLSVQNKEQAEGVIAELAIIAGKRNAIDLAKNQTIDQAKADASLAIAPLDARKKELEGELRKYAQLNRAELFAEAKSLKLAFGCIGFRASSKLMQMNGIDEAMTLSHLKSFKFFEAIRIEESLNKEVMEAWPDERLESIGLRRQNSDSFYVEIDHKKTPAK